MIVVGLVQEVSGLSFETFLEAATELGRSLTGLKSPLDATCSGQSTSSSFLSTIIMEPGDLYSVLGVRPDASSTQIRRAYRNLLTTAHPDKGGNAQTFQRIQQAYEVLSDIGKRKTYNATGRIEKGVDEDFLDGFGNGNFRDRTRDADVNDQNGASASGGMAELIVPQPNADPQSHTAGFEAWLRSRGTTGTSVLNAEVMAERYGVVKSSYEPVPLTPGDIFRVECTGAGQPSETLSLSTMPLPAELEWGQVLVHMKFAPISPADIYSARLGGIYGSESVEAPYIAGHDGVGIVIKVGPGIKLLREGDVVLPLLRAFPGTWAAARVWRERDLLRLASVDAGLASAPGDSSARTSAAGGPSSLPALPLQLCALARELLCGYRLLEMRSDLKPGDCVIINAANSTIGQILLQLSRLLRLRAIAVVRTAATVGSTASAITEAAAAGTVPAGPASLVSTDTPGVAAVAAAVEWEGTVTWLRSLGASEVIRDQGSVKLELERRKFFARPKLALDAVGGDSGLRIADALGEGGSVVVYGCMSGKSPSWPWQAWVFRGLSVSGFNVRHWMATAGTPALLARLEALGKLVDARLLKCDYTEYDISEFPEALEHSLEPHRNTKVLLRMSEPAITPVGTASALGGSMSGTGGT